jgi:hypothetical protein
MAGKLAALECGQHPSSQQIDLDGELMEVPNSTNHSPHLRTRTMSEYYALKLEVELSMNLAGVTRP